MIIHTAKGQILQLFKVGSSSSFKIKVFSGCFAIKSHVGSIYLFDQIQQNVIGKKKISNQSIKIFLKVCPKKHQSLRMVWKIFLWFSKFGKYCITHGPTGDLSNILQALRFLTSKKTNIQLSSKHRTVPNVFDHENCSPSNTY